MARSTAEPPYLIRCQNCSQVMIARASLALRRAVQLRFISTRTPYRTTLRPSESVAGHSLDAIRRILSGRTVEAPAQPPRIVPRVGASAELWTRIKVMEGVELHFNAARHQPEAEKLLALRDAIREVFVSATED